MKTASNPRFRRSEAVLHAVGDTGFEAENSNSSCTPIHQQIMVLTCGFSETAGWTEVDIKDHETPPEDYVGTTKRGVEDG
ncbi:hypothetical protein GCM10007231_24890 [Nocardioides daphniae]|uniref:Uncharacterized protein n=1 Tax=Nocardioides daphniae TaxID=402297 RepID=A0ABQ1QEF0_9ACTN|nr:hypothetical protein GCM10007231_24890 [Nocardioides daphniae]